MNSETITDKPTRNVVLLVGHPDLTVTWSRYGQGEVGTDLHVHREHTDAFYVLDGELTFDVGPDPRTIRVAAGGFVAVPPDVGHGFRNDGDADARWFNFHAPDKGFADFMRGLRDGIPIPWDSFDVPEGGGLPEDQVTVTASGGAALPELRVCSDGAHVVVEAGGKVLRLDA